MSRCGWMSVGALLVAALACNKGAAEPAPPQSSPPAGQAAASQPAAPPPVAAANEPLSGRFLVHTKRGAVVERDATSARGKTLVPHAETALYDPALELLWYIDANQLHVLDLRLPAQPPVLIVRDMKQMDRLTVVHDGHYVSVNDGCDEPYAVLEWSSKPRVKLFLADTPARVRIDGLAWLKQELKRPARPGTPPRMFLEDKVELPAALLDCEDDELCGTSIPFANRGWQLVLIQFSADGDCAERACLLRDSKKERYATPPHPQQWNAPDKTKPGPCGPYRFDRSGAAYLVEHWVCVAEAPCKDLGGEALGWREPGDVIGE